ncbi:Ppx/GppA phosphatase family-domain-containing protein [Parachaetomium inaequale]|uniref:Ppx/GppA phosphatase family-domain-containing protein n=1 Tax=Parachaetomium inaequale TaxID=2588326 RepID=A0AAN6P9D8_9PEZI|nr:Ppx/GppA phosphatase family-domain-containing protein [Parachaetomium inaequale]
MDALVDIITLDNLEQKLPRWDPSSASHLFALVDMGSNGVRFSILDLSPPRTRLLRCIYRERAAISLFDALSGPSLLFPDETIKLVSRTLARFRSIAIDDYGVPPSQVRVFATEAMRRAQNATAMLEAIRAESPGLSVYILAPPVETLFGSVGARSGFVDVKGLFLDLGGGSVQMTYLDSYASKSRVQKDSVGPEVAAALAGQSLPFGAARLIKVLDNSDAATQASEISRLRGGMSEAFKTLCAKFSSLAADAAEAQQSGAGEGGKATPGLDVYLCGGGFRGYGSMLMYRHPVQPYPIPSIGSFTVSGNVFGQTKDLLEFNRSFDGKIFGMSKRRRAQFPAIVAVVDALIAAVPSIRSVTFCSGGNREGALMMSLPREIRDSNPLTHSGDGMESSTPSAPGADPASYQDVLDALRSAFPPDLDLATTTTVFGLQLGALYARQIWTQLGYDAETNASAALHHAVSCPDQPGLTHLTRAVLGVTTCARWGASLAPVDEQLHKNLRALMDAADPDASFWADYTGSVTAAMVALVKRWPRTPRAIQDKVRFRATAEHGKKLKVQLEIFINEEAATGVDLDDIIDRFKCLKKHKHEGKKVTVTINPLP